VYKKTYFPFVSTSYLSDMNKQEFEFYSMVNRKDKRADKRLIELARAKAYEMGNLDYFDHVSPDGRTPHQWVRTSYSLPKYYPEQGNYIETIVGGVQDATEAYNTSIHKNHIQGRGLHASQSTVAVGFAQVKGSRYQYYWVFWSVP